MHNAGQRRRRGLGAVEEDIRRRQGRVKARLKESNPRAEKAEGRRQIERWQRYGARWKSYYQSERD